VSSSRPGRCLGDRIVDLADGRLDPAAAERAYAHVAVCPRCRAALETQREVRARLAQTPPEPAQAPDDLIARLRGIPAVPPDATIPAQPAAGHGSAGRAGVRPGVRAVSTGPTPARRRHRTRIALASAAGAAALAVAAVVGGGSAAVSGPARTTPSIAPVVDRLTDAHESSTDQMPFSGPRIVTAAFDSPSGSSSPQP
jgi:anti-sigma factor RsiW